MLSQISNLGFRYISSHKMSSSPLPRLLGRGTCVFSQKSEHLSQQHASAQMIPEGIAQSYWQYYVDFMETKGGREIASSIQHYKEQQNFLKSSKESQRFLAEFELYVVDLLVGTVVNVALVGMLAPYDRIGRPSNSGLLGRMQQAYAALPSNLILPSRSLKK